MMNNKRMLAVITFLGLFSFMPLNGFAAVWYVDGEVLSSGNGTSWLVAFKSIQDAIDAANNSDEIWVKMGTYTLSATIEVNKPVGIYGGFAGWETQRNQRDWETNVTTIDLGGHARCFQVNGDVTFDGLVVARGYSDGGGGIRNESSSILRLDNCTITQNFPHLWGWGGGMVNLGEAIVNNCTFVGNWGENHSGIYNSGSLIVRNSSFIENMGEGTGGGIVNGGSMIVQNSLFVRNNASWGGWGGGIANSGDGIISNCTFYGNRATMEGGAISNGGTLTVTNSILWGDTARSGPEIYDWTSSMVVTHNNIQGGYPGEGNIDIDPAFVDPENGDFHLRWSSPCIDAGTRDALALPPTDFEGDPRILGVAPDMGVDEFERIEIKPGDNTNTINLRGMKTIPVAILSAIDFYAPSEVAVDQTTLTFGHTGDEQSQLSCATRKPKDVNEDGIKDLVCQFSTKLAGFVCGDTEGILKGMTVGGRLFEGSQPVVIAPCK